jgi:hypothetical protein
MIKNWQELSFTIKEQPRFYSDFDFDFTVENDIMNINIKANPRWENVLSGDLKNTWQPLEIFENAVSYGYVPSFGHVGRIIRLDSNIGWINIPKNASTSIRKITNSFRTEGIETKVEWLLKYKDYKLFAVLRDPIDRLKSGFKQYIVENQFLIHNMNHFKKNIDKIFSYPRDPHMLPNFVFFNKLKLNDIHFIIGLDNVDVKVISWLKKQNLEVDKTIFEKVYENNAINNNRKSDFKPIIDNYIDTLDDSSVLAKLIKKDYEFLNIIKEKYYDS